MRTIIEVPEEVIQSLDQVCEREGRSRAAVICEAITDYLCRKTTLSTVIAFGLWKDKPKDGLKYQNELRSDWKA